MRGSLRIKLSAIHHVGRHHFFIFGSAGDAIAVLVVQSLGTSIHWSNSHRPAICITCRHISSTSSNRNWLAARFAPARGSATRKAEWPVRLSRSLYGYRRTPGECSNQKRVLMRSSMSLIEVSFGLGVSPEGSGSGSRDGCCRASRLDSGKFPANARPNPRQHFIPGSRSAPQQASAKPPPPPCHVFQRPCMRLDWAIHGQRRVGRRLTGLISRQATSRIRTV